MGQGQDKIALSLVDLQPTAIVELFELYFNTIDKENSVLYFHGGANFEKDIVWAGQSYIRIPIESEGFEVTANGQLPRPKMRISNRDYFITKLLLENNDLQFAKVIRKRTFVKYLDDVNFDGGNPWSQADASAELSNDTFVISQKTAENKTFVEFELSSPLDLENFEINARLLMSRYCSWYYRGNGCNYAGPPIETEYNEAIVMNNNSLSNWATVSKNNKWKTGVNYLKGDAVFLENTKILINPVKQKEGQAASYAKIWYVAQIDHLSTTQNYPDENETYWIKDGCNKKLEGCKKRFQNSEFQVLNALPITRTNNFVDLSHRQSQPTNNIASQASITGSSVIDESSFENAVDGLTGSSLKTADTGYSWISEGSDDPSLTLTWDRLYPINRIDLYDRDKLTNNFGTAEIRLFNGASQVLSGQIPVNTDGSRTTTGFATVYADRLQVSGIGSTNNAGLGEVCVFEPSGLGLYNSSFKSSGIYAQNNLHIASWFQFPKGVSRTDQKYNILHNVSVNNQYSGINLYASGNGNLFLDFATVQISGSSPTASIVKRSLQLPWDTKSLQSVHLEAYGGKTNGAIPSSFPNGYLRISDYKGNEAKYSLAPKNSSTQFSGEFFLFKNPSYTGAMTDLFLGVNNWQFATGNPLPELVPNRGVYSNNQLTSSIKFGATAIWTGKSGVDYRKSFFNRNDPNALNENSKNTTPRTYQEVTGDQSVLRKDLFAWWDMDLSSGPIYKVDSSNSPVQSILLSGQYTGSMDSSLSTKFTPKVNLITSERNKYLPFGGFPGTDRYGR
jgi:lambda family phage minor tail protein L